VKIPNRQDRRPPPKRTFDDQRGITLQTLIVTAVLVLLAVAAGVVIVAITDNSADDLEDQASDLEGKCALWEVHDVEAEARGIGGPSGSGGITSSKVGCFPACYFISPSVSPAGITIPSGNLNSVATIQAAEAELDAGDALFFSKETPEAFHILPARPVSFNQPPVLNLRKLPDESQPQRMVAAGQTMAELADLFSLTPNQINNLMHNRGNNGVVEAAFGFGVRFSASLYRVNDETEFSDDNHSVRYDTKLQTCQLFDTSTQRTVIPLQ